MAADREISFKGTVKNNAVVIEDHDAFQYQLLDFEGKEVRMSIKPWRNSRTLEANGYYWGVVVAYIAEETGMTPEEVHQELARMFLKYHHPESGREYVRSTSDLNTKEFSTYTQQCIEWAAAFLFVEIPLPSNDPWWKSLVSMKRLDRPKDFVASPRVFEDVVLAKSSEV